MLVQFGNNWIQKIPLTAKLDSACGLVQFWLSSEFFSSNYFQIGQHVVLLHTQIGLLIANHVREFCNSFDSLCNRPFLSCFLSALKRVFVRNHSYKNVLRVQVLIFSFARGLVLKQRQSVS